MPGRAIRFKVKLCTAAIQSLSGGEGQATRSDAWKRGRSRIAHPLPVRAPALVDPPPLKGEGILQYAHSSCSHSLVVSVANCLASYDANFAVAVHLPFFAASEASHSSP